MRSLRDGLDGMEAAKASQSATDLPSGPMFSPRTMKRASMRYKHVSLQIDGQSMSRLHEYISPESAALLDASGGASHSSPVASSGPSAGKVDKPAGMVSSPGVQKRRAAKRPVANVQVDEAAFAAADARARSTGKLVWSSTPVGEDDDPELLAFDLPDLSQYLMSAPDVPGEILSTLLHTYTYATSSAELLDALVTSYTTTTGKSSSSKRRERVERFVSILTFWVARQYSDFRNQEMMKKLDAAVVLVSSSRGARTDTISPRMRASTADSAASDALASASGIGSALTQQLELTLVEAEILHSLYPTMWYSPEIYEREMLHWMSESFQCFTVEEGAVGKKKLRKGDRAATGADIVREMALTLPAIAREAIVSSIKRLVASAALLAADGSDSFSPDSSMYILRGKLVKSLRAAPASSAQDGPAAPDELLSLSPLDAARQLTLILFDLFRAIPRTELMGQLWLSKDVVRTPRLNAFIAEVNRVSYWVATEVVTQKVTKKRVKTIQFFIRLAESSEQLGNFSTMMAVIAGLSLSCVSRLEDSWGMVDRGLKHNMDRLVSLSSGLNNFKEYRALKDVTNPPGIPSVSLYLRDMTFAEDGNETRLPDGLINYSKMTILAKLLADFQKYQQVVFPIAPAPEIQSFLRSRRVVRDDAELRELSLDIEASRRHSQQIPGR